MIINILKKSCCIAVLFITFHQTVFAQVSMSNIDPDAEFKMAKEFYLKEQFNLAYLKFKKISDNPSALSKLPISTQLEAAYYTIVTGLKMNEPGAETAAKEFIATEYNAARTQMLSYQLGEYYFRKQDYAGALSNYEKCGIDNLTNREIAEMKFHQAYAFFTDNQFKKAKPLFNSIRQITSDPNYLDASYYYGFISFYEKDYKSALDAFRKVESQSTYQKIVPYYIAEILYFNGDKNKAIEYGEAKLKTGGQYYDAQLRQLVGHAYFENKNYKKALPYLEEYVAKTEKVRREDLYELSYAYYENNQLNKAIEGFKQLGGKEDSLAQNSMYLLGDLYLKKDQKANARSAFLFCASNSSNVQQKEISAFNYAKLSFELGYQDVASVELKNFISSYPSSVYVGEAKELLVNVLAKTNNYKEALSLYESLQGKSESVKRAYPTIIYGRAVEFINEQQLLKADTLLTTLLASPYNNAQIPYAHFWKGEIAYRTNNFDDAISHLSAYLKNTVTSGEVNVMNARYTLGHAYMQKENYQQALGFFEQVTKKITPQSSSIEQDAYLRSADCYFINRNYTKAQEMYEGILSYNLAGADYALFQKAIIYGAGNRIAEKISLLQTLEQRFPSSALIPNANLEIANTYLGEEDFRSAIPPLNSIIKSPDASAIHPQGYLKLGIAHFNLDNNQDALVDFKKLISSYPNSPESDAAIEYIRNIFIEDQKPAEFVTFMRQNGKTISYSEEDSLTYASAEIRFNNNDQANALKGYIDYLKKFPDGRYSLEANYNAAEIYNSKKEFSKALIGYSYIALKSPNKFAQKSILQAARINFFELKNYQDAEKYFIQLKSIATQPDIQLEAMRGLLRSQFRLNKWTEAVQNAQELITQKGLATDDKMMANMILAKDYQNNGENELAMSAYRTVFGLGKSEFAAEARFQIAFILFQQNKFPDAEKAAFEVVNKAGSYEYWTTKAYILLGEIYWKQKDYFNAEATLKSVAENATIPELKQDAQSKLDQLIIEKNANSKVQ